MVEVGIVFQIKELLADDFWPAPIYNQWCKALIYSNMLKYWS